MDDYEWKLTIETRRKGGPGSGNFGHAGRPGQVGGSASGGGSGTYGQGRPPPSPSDFSAPEVDNTALALEGYVAGLPRRDYLDADGDIRSRVKKGIVSELSGRSGVSENETNYFIAQWAESSNDNDMRSLAIQRDTADEFGISLSDFTKDKISQINADIERRVDEYAKERMFSPFKDKPDEAREWLIKGTPEYRSVLPADSQKRLLRSMYDSTQEWFKESGVSGNIILNRGVKLPYNQTKGLKVGDVIDVTGNALESWSIHKPVADTFARLRHTGEVGQIRGLTLRMSVPVEAIVGSARTGFGCLTEGEFVVLGIPGKAEVVEISG